MTLTYIHHTHLYIYIFISLYSLYILILLFFHKISIETAYFVPLVTLVHLGSSISSCRRTPHAIAQPPSETAVSRVTVMRITEKDMTGLTTTLCFNQPLSPVKNQL